MNHNAFLAVPMQSSTPKPLPSHLEMLQSQSIPQILSHTVQPPGFMLLGLPAASCSIGVLGCVCVFPIIDARGACCLVRGFVSPVAGSLAHSPVAVKFVKAHSWRSGLARLGPAESSMPRIHATTASAVSATAMVDVAVLIRPRMCALETVVRVGMI